MRTFLSALLGVVALLPAQTDWDRPDADRIFASLTLEQKVGQLFMAWALSSGGDSSDRQVLLEQVREGKLGGVVISTGTMGDARRLVAALQRAASVPLLIAADFETGLTMRLSDAPHLGNGMLLGATGSSHLAFEVGRATGLEGQVLGVQMVFAPVLDVNINPSNPIINVRSMGEDPALVARLGAAQIRGMEEYIIATAKHFPGHGDVAADSHLVLPTVPGDRARLEAVELLPFRSAVDAGVGGVMTAHLMLPALDQTVPATMSRRILTGLLREEMGFEGIIVTDALNMGGVSASMTPEEAAVRALQAGADLLLMPPDLDAATEKVVAAVRSGEVSSERLDQAVRRLLEAKERRVRIGAAADPLVGLPPATWDTHRELGQKIARRGLTLVRDNAGLLPLRPGAEVFVLDVADESGRFGDHLVGGLLGSGMRVAHRRLNPDSDQETLSSVMAAAASAETLVVGIHTRVRAFSGEVGLPPTLIAVARALEEHPRGIAVSFGDPYLVRAFPSVSTYICAYDQGELIESAVAEALTGRAPITGRLPVSIPGLAQVGDGLSSFLSAADAAPADQGLAPDLSPRIREFLRGEVARGAFPGAVALVSRRGQVLARVAVGQETYAEDAPAVTVDTRYDLASLTKVCATLPAMALLMERGGLHLEDKLSKWVPEFIGEGKEAVTLRHVMVHSSGLPAHRPFYRDLEGKAAVVAAAAGTDLEYLPGEKYLYSDLGLILLMAVVEKASGTTLDRLLATDVYPRLGVEAQFALGNEALAAVPTEEDSWRGRLVRGQVHDENAFAMGGVSGHAGLFATADDVARIGNLFLGGGGGLISPALSRRITRRDGLLEGSGRTLLFGGYTPGSSGGSMLSPRAFGHTGFTGTSLWCDPATDLCLVLLTNRVHPTRDNSKITAARRGFADLVMSSLRTP